MLNVRITHKHNYILITLSGRFDAYGAGIFTGQTADLEEGSKFWIVDMTEADYLSSAGIKALLEADKSLQMKKGKMAVYGISENLMRIIQISGTKNIFKIVPTIDEAVKLL
ncbi:STAS domain-containing protein [bacterium]|nr:STAS domain-containing protein [bacterium]